MKKLSQIVMILAVTLSPFAFSGSVAAADCTISNTGPGSNNSCEVVADYKCEIDNNNNIVVKDKNDQTAGTGKATVGDNTNGGSATSGSATNSNGTTFDVTIENGTACTVASVTPGQGATTPPAPTPTAPVTPAANPAPGQGAVVAPVAAPQRVAPTVLPNTSTESTIGVILGLVTLLGSAILGSRLAVNTYSRMTH